MESISQAFKFKIKGDIVLFYLRKVVIKSFNHSNILSRYDLDLICGLLFSCKLIEEKALQRKNYKRRLNPNNRQGSQSSISVVVFCESLNSILYTTLLLH